MIKNQDRSGYFGASDTNRVIAKNRSTKTWKQWWSVKLGLAENEQVNSRAMAAGTMYEHPIIHAMDEDIKTDGQIIYEKYLLRVNYDGWKDGIIFEIKTHKAEKPFEVTEAYRRQCQVEMYAYQKMQKELELPEFKKLWLVSYGLNEDEYEPEEKISIDPNRIVYHPVAYDEHWIKGEYLPKLKELARALKKGKFPG